MDRKYTLLIDQDDVLAEYILGVVEAYNAKYETDFKTTDCKTWDLCSVFGTQIETVMHEPKLFRELKPVSHALEVFERLYRDERFDIYIVTAAHLSCVEAKSEWLKEYLPFFPEDHFIVCRKKNMIKGDFLLDDGMHNIEAFAKAGGTPIVFDRPHNARHKGPYRRVKDWLQFEQLILDLCKDDEEQAIS